MKLRITLGLACCTLLLSSGCKSKTVETEAAKPEYLDTTSINVSCYGDSIVFEVEDVEAIQSYNDSQIILLPDRENFDTIQIDYVEGNSLNDFAEAYYASISDSLKSDFKDNSFTTDNYAYALQKTDKNNYIIVKGPVLMKNYCKSLARRFQ